MNIHHTKIVAAPILCRCIQTTTVLKVCVKQHCTGHARMFQGGAVAHISRLCCSSCTSHSVGYHALLQHACTQRRPDCCHVNIHLSLGYASVAVVEPILTRQHCKCGKLASSVCESKILSAHPICVDPASKRKQNRWDRIKFD